MTELRKQIESIFDAEQEAAKHREKVKARSDKAQRMGGKAAAMGDGDSVFKSSNAAKTAGKAAFDHVQNLDEQRAETEEERARRGRKAVKEFGR